MFLALLFILFLTCSLVAPNALFSFPQSVGSEGSDKATLIELCCTDPCKNCTKLCELLGNVPSLKLTTDQDNHVHCHHIHTLWDCRR